MIAVLIIGGLVALALYLAQRLAASTAEISALRNRNASLKRQLGHRNG